MPENKYNTRLPETVSLNFWQSTRKFLKSLTPLSNPNPELGTEIVRYIQYLNEIKSNLTLVQNGLTELLNQTKTPLINCNFNPLLAKSQALTFISKGEIYQIGNFSPAKIEAVTENQVFGVGSKIETQNFSGEAKNNPEGIKESKELFNELASQNPTMILMPATFDSEMLKKHINSKGYHYIYTAITESSNGKKDIGNAVAIRSDIDISKLKIKLISSGRQVPHWVWESNPDEVIKEVQPFVYHDMVVEFSEKEAAAVVYHSPHASALERMEDYLNLLEYSSNYTDKLLISGDFNTTGPASDIANISMITKYIAKNLKYPLPSGTWNLKFLSQMGGGSELDLYRLVAESMGLRFYKPSKPTLALDGALNIVADLKLDAMITNLDVDHSFSDIQKTGADHTTQSTEIISDQVFPLSNQDFKPKRELALKKIEKKRFLAILLADAIAIAIGGLGGGMFGNMVNEKYQQIFPETANSTTQVEPLSRLVK